MHPQIQAPSREQVLAHFQNMLTQKNFALGLYEKQKKAKDIRFAIAMGDFKDAELAGDAVHLMSRAAMVFEAASLEHECDVANLDFMIVQTKLEIENIEKMKKDAESSIVDPRKMGVVM